MLHNLTKYKKPNDYFERTAEDIVTSVHLAGGDLTQKQVNVYALVNEYSVDHQQFVYLYRNEEKTIEVLEAEMKRLKGNLANLKDQHELTSAMVSQFYPGKTSLGFCTITHRESTETVIDNFEMLPRKFIIEKKSYVPDKIAIKAAINAKEVVPGAQLIKNDNLTIE